MKLLKRIADIIVRIQKLNSNLRDVRNLTLESNLNNAIRESVNPLNKFGRKVFSQSDEDGITLEIVRRLEIMSSTGTYVELGVGNGLENNTLVLASLGWKGVWIGGESLEFAHENLKRMNFNMAWIKRSNILELVRNGLNQISSDHVDVLSIDLDGNDIYIAEELLCASILPKVVIIEYNAKFPPPILFQIDYEEDFVWQRDDYFGASLQSMQNFFNNYGYTLIACNLGTGSNCFFVRNEYVEKFLDIPREIEQIYVPPKYFLQSDFGYPASTKVVLSVLGLVK